MPGCAPLLIVILSNCNNNKGKNELKADSAAIIAPNAATTATPLQQKSPFASMTPIDTAAYDRIIKELANGDTTGKWPVKAPYL